MLLTGRLINKRKGATVDRWKTVIENYSSTFSHKDLKFKFQYTLQNFDHSNFFNIKCF